MGQDRRIGWLLFALALVVLVLGAHGYVENFDGDVEYLTARALWRRGDPGLLAHAADTSARELKVVTERDPQSGRVGFDVMPGRPERGGRCYSWFGIAHAALEAPLYGLGSALAGWFPDAEARWLARARARQSQVMAWLPEEEPFQRLCVSMLSPLCGAAIVVVLFLLARTLGASPPAATAAALVAAFGTQLWPQARESLSDTQGGLFFLLAMLGMLRWWRGQGGAGALALAGACIGLAVLTRVQHGAGLILASGVVGVLALRRGRGRELLALVAAALPFAAFFLWFNWWRFGDPLETGYGAATSGTFWHRSGQLTVLFLGCLLLSPAKGVLLFSPPVWALLWAWPRARARVLRGPLLLAVVLFLVAWFPPALIMGWHSGWTWGCRFLTPTVLLITVLSLALLVPPWPRLVRALAVLGVAVSLGGILTPAHGFLRLAINSVRGSYPEVPEHLRDVPVFVPPVLEPWSRQWYSPLVGHWIYFGQNLTGTLQSSDVAAIHRAYGWPPVPDLGPFPLPEDVGFRHLWYVNLADLIGFPAWPVAGSGLVLAAGLALALRRALKAAPAARA